MEKIGVVANDVRLPYEVFDILRGLSTEALVLYTDICHCFHIRENWPEDGDWVIGSFRAKKVDIIDKARISQGTFYKTCFAELRTAGLLIESEEEEGIFLLPMFIAKIDSINPAETDRFYSEAWKEIRQITGRLEQLHKAMQTPPDNKRR